MKTTLTADAARRVHDLLSAGRGLYDALAVIEYGLTCELGVESGAFDDVVTDAVQAGWTVEQLCEELAITIQAD
jgi:hypothetical protein